MIFGSVGTNLSGLYADGVRNLGEALDTARELCLAAATRDPVSVRAGV